MMQRTRQHSGLDAGQGTSQVPACNRTWVIIMAQVVAIVGLVVVWSVLRSRRAGTAS